MVAHHNVNYETGRYTNNGSLDPCYALFLAIHQYSSFPPFW